MFPLLVLGTVTASLGEGSVAWPLHEDDAPLLRLLLMDPMRTVTCVR